MKNKILIPFLLLNSIFLFSQEKEDLFILETDTTWGKELFQFPLGFAPEINFEGIEDARFPAGWGKIDSSTFWSYVFAWNINLNALITEKELENNLQIYFDGLMNAVNKDKEIEVPNTVVLFLKKEVSENRAKFIGKVRVYDSFRTKKMMTLNVQVTQDYCKIKNKSIIIFRFSPKGFGDEVWQQLERVNLRANACDL